jgi:DNA-directed RNA polymerase specialized sigma24 family protein
MTASPHPTDHGDAPTPYDAAAGRVLGSGGAAAPDSGDLRVVVAALARFLAGWRLTREDAEELAQEVIVQTLTLQRQRALVIDRPGAYLFSAVRNRALDRLRHERRGQAVVARLEGGARYSDDDDAVAALLERTATAEAVEFAMRAAGAADDRVAIRVVASWLELAEELGREPTSREVAPVAGVSHTSVNQALRRFRAYFPADVPRTSSE